jgi:hypothetical protein
MLDELSAESCSQLSQVAEMVMAGKSRLPAAVQVSTHKETESFLTVAT